MGAYQTLGNLLIDLPAHTNVTAYRRDLDLGDALARVKYQCRGTAFAREYFCSHADGVLVVRLTADHPGAYTGQLALKDAHGALTVAGPDSLTAAGHLDNGLL
jgi:alpha-L-fucosidase 2